jgi:hypothetical protein
VFERIRQAPDGAVPSALAAWRPGANTSMETPNMSIESFFADIGGYITTEVTKAVSEATQLGEQLVSTGVADVATVFQEGAPLAVQAILAEAPKAISGQEKFSNAVINVYEQLQAKLGPVVEADVQALVQMAYQGLQKIAQDG